MRRRGVFGVVVVVIALCLPAAAAGKAFKVTTKADPLPGDCTAGSCSLREAVLAANARPGKDSIVLPSRKGAYKLSQPSSNEDGAMDGDLDITNDPVDVLHKGQGRATIDADGTDRVFQVFPGAPTSFTKLVIRGGAADAASLDGSGGGIIAQADVALVAVQLLRNEAVDDGGGISIHNDSGASLTIRNSVVTRNVTGDDGGGVAIEEDGDGEATGKLVISKSKITRNQAVGNFGGGVFVQRPALITKTTIDRNRAENAAGLGVEDNPATVKATAITRNVATDSEAGGVELEAPGRLVNVTIANNRAAGEGGGIWTDVEGSRLNGVTISGNVANTGDDGATGGGIFLEGKDSGIRLDNTLLAKNRLAEGTKDTCDGTEPTSGGSNLADSDSADCGLEAAKKDVRDKPAGIGKLGRNGGPTETVPLKAGSQAVGKAGGDAPGRDQRGVRRNDPDIGAYERR